MLQMLEAGILLSVDYDLRVSTQSCDSGSLCAI